MSIRLLIIEDCNIIAKAYKAILNQVKKPLFTITIAKNCDEALLQLQKTKPELVVLDLQLPASKNERFISGEDVGMYIRNEFPETKIIIITSYTNRQRVLAILNGINPDGFMIKSDIESEDFKKSIELVLEGKQYYSETIEKISSTPAINGIVIDDFDRQILYHLSLGEKTKDLKNFIPLSTRAIEERKVKLKALLNDDKDPNFNLVKTAKILGLV